MAGIGVSGGVFGVAELGGAAVLVIGGVRRWLLWGAERVGGGVGRLEDV